MKIPKTSRNRHWFSGGKDLYEKLIKGYTEKQWGRPATQIPAFIIRRLPFRFTFDNNYFNDPYQGIPIGGYTNLVTKLLKNVEVKTDINYFEQKTELDKLSEKIIYTGKIDEYLEYKFGKLEYRSLHFENELLEMHNFQGNAVVNYTERKIPYTRIIEHKHFEYGIQEVTYITKEYPHEFSKDKEPFYPINDVKNQTLLHKYQELAKNYPQVLFGGRLAEYEYYDMDKIIERSLNFNI